jgi:hypothetical protein
MNAKCAFLAYIDSLLMRTLTVNGPVESRLWWMIPRREQVFNRYSCVCRIIDLNVHVSVVDVSLQSLFLSLMMLVMTVVMMKCFTLFSCDWICMAGVGFPLSLSFFLSLSLSLFLSRVCVSSLNKNQEETSQKWSNSTYTACQKQTGSECEILPFGTLCDGSKQFLSQWIRCLT